MKSTRYIGLMMLAASMMAATSCSDFDDYNSNPLDQSEAANKTLWENISGNSDLTEFASLLRKAGYDKMLSQPTFYTVFAPLNGTFDATALQQEDSATLRSHFAENHIALYNHQVSCSIDERVKTLNEKSYELKGNGSYTIGGKALSQTNMPSINGVMHTINGEMMYYPNIYEYIFQSTGCDSLKSFYKHYEHTYLDTENSTIGPVVNGKQTYIDSVMVANNDLFGKFDARLATEDSSYTMLFPTDKAWTMLYNKISPYYHYITTTRYQDVQNAKSMTNIPEGSPLTIDAAYYTDSLTKMRMTQFLVFNNNDKYNRWLENGGVNTDTLRSTTGYTLSDPQLLLNGTVEKQTMSNGYVRIMDSITVHPWDTYAMEVRNLNSASTMQVFNGTVEYVNVNADRINKSKVTLQNKATSLRYLHAEPTSNFAKPALILSLPSVLSTDYNLYAVIVPQNVDKSYATTAVNPNQLDFEVSYCDADGNLVKKKLNQKVENDPMKVDTVFVGKVSFPVCYYGLGSAVAPNLKITTDFNVYDKKMRDKYTRDIRLASIIMRPVTYDEYLSNKN